MESCISGFSGATSVNGDQTSCAGISETRIANDFQVEEIAEDEEIPVVAVKFIEYDLNNRNHKINGKIEQVPLNKIIGFNTDVFKKDVI